MARHKEFDKAEVLEKAMMLFWRQGYEATSVRDLMEVTGISSSSLYESFGDKRTLYLAALRLYCQGEAASFQTMIKQLPSLKDVITHAFRNAREQAQVNSLGLFSMNSIIEFGNRDAEITALLWAHYEAIWGSLRDAIQAAQSEGQIRNQMDANGIAHALLTAVYGHASLMRVKPDFDASEGILQSLQILLE